jgi:voltage-gated potassium channel
VVRDRGEAFERFSRAVDGPLTVLALVMIPLIVLPLVVDLSPGTESAFLAIDYLIWAVFAAEYAIKLYLAPNRRQFVARHIPDLIIVVVPMLRPLRVLRSVRLLRLLRLVRLAAFAAKGVHETRGILRHRGLRWVLLIVLVLNLIAAAMVLEFERGNPDANITSYPDALWWAVTTELDWRREIRRSFSRSLHPTLGVTGPHCLDWPFNLTCEDGIAGYLMDD